MRKFLSLSATAVLAFAALLVAPTAAQAAIPAHCTPHFTVAPVQYHTNDQTVSLALVPRNVTFNVVFKVPVTEFNDCPAITAWELEAGDQVNGGGDRNLYVHVSRSSPVSVLDSRRLDNTDAGNVFQVAYWYRADGNWFSDTEVLTVKRATMFTGFNASPEPVLRGNQILNRGTLLRANWDAQTFTPYAGRTIKYQNRDAAGGPYIVRTTNNSPLVTDNAGFASGSRRADITRFHRFAFYGNTTAGASASSPDHVIVTP